MSERFELFDTLNVELSTCLLWYQKDQTRAWKCEKKPFVPSLWGWCQCFFSQICEVGELVIMHKIIEDNIAKKFG